MKSKTITADVNEREYEAAAIEPEQPRPQQATVPSADEIRHRAYELHLEHGCMHGRDQEDWLEAERDLTEKYQSLKTSVSSQTSRRAAVA